VEHLDCRGLSCPLPVVEARKGINRLPEGGSLQVLLDSATARDNVSRMAAREGCEAQVKELENGEFVLTIRKG